MRRPGIQGNRAREAYYDKFKIATVIGTFILLSHVAVVVTLWMINLPDASTAKETTYPVLAIYALGFVKWMIDNQSNIQGKGVVRSYVVMLAILSATMIGGHLALPAAYLNHWIDLDQLNGGFVILEVAFGSMFSLVFTDLFEKQSSSEPLVVPSPLQ